MAGTIEDLLLESHGTANRTIPFPLGETLWHAAGGPQRFVRIEAAEHNHWLTEPYLQELDAFIARLAAPQE